jgi:uncharacterized protein YqeY
MPETPEVEPLEQRLRQALPKAMKARDAAAVSALRTTLAAIANAEAVEAPAVPETTGRIAGARIGVGAGEAARAELSEEQIASIVRAEVAERVEAAADYERAGQAEPAERLRAEAAVLTAHLGES